MRGGSDTQVGCGVCQAGPKSPVFTPAANSRQSAAVNISFGPAGSLLSRTATMPGRFRATSTQFPAFPLYDALRQIGACQVHVLSHLGDQFERSTGRKRFCSQGIENLHARLHDIGMVGDLPLRGGVQVHHLRRIPKLGDHERAATPTWAPAVAGTIENLHLWTLRHLDQVANCSRMIFAVADLAPEHPLVHDRPQHRRILGGAGPPAVASRALACARPLHRWPRAALPGASPSVCGRFQQPRNDRQFPGSQREGFAFDAGPLAEPGRPHLTVQLFAHVIAQPPERAAGPQFRHLVAAPREVLGRHPARRLDRADQRGRVTNPLTKLLLAQPGRGPVVTQFRAE